MHLINSQMYFHLAKILSNLHLFCAVFRYSLSASLFQFGEAFVPLGGPTYGPPSNSCLQTGRRFIVIEICGLSWKFDSYG